jgi:hypothetical protein
MYWEELNIQDGKYKKIVCDLGYAKIIIIGPTEEGGYWWNVKLDEKGLTPTVDGAKKAALKLLNLPTEDI